MPKDSTSIWVFCRETASAPSTVIFQTIELASTNKTQRSIEIIANTFLDLYRLNVYFIPSFRRILTFTPAFAAALRTFFKYSEASMHIVNSFSEICVSSQIAIRLLKQIFINFCGLGPDILILT